MDVLRPELQDLEAPPGSVSVRLLRHRRGEDGCDNMGDRGRVIAGDGVVAHLIVKDGFLLGVLHLLVGISCRPIGPLVVAIAMLQRIELFERRHAVW